MKQRGLSVLCAGLLLTAFIGGEGRARACLNDRDSDSLANEAKKLPDVVRVVTGRFERNPPLFYQMRIDRVQKEIALHPERLALYDDVAVAYDRLGNDTAAIAWIGKKRAKLAQTLWETARPEIREAWYRYYANVGTFRAHQWIKSGADRTKLGEVVRARDEIARAIQIKPNAHFNRERIQLLALQWIINPKRKPYPNLPNEYTYPFGDYLEQPAVREAPDVQSEGLCGLIVLGNAWESPDITGALVGTLRLQGKNKVAYLAYLRCREIIEKGRVSIVLPAAATPNKTVESVLMRWPQPLEQDITNPKNVEAKYLELRREADDWQKHRTAYLISRLEAGRHPDTDSAFWSDFKDTVPPPLDVDWRREWRGNYANFLMESPGRAAAIFFGELVLAGVAVWVLIRCVKSMRRSYVARRRLQRATSRPE